jgi:cytochrome d ubiquinol oxidase subunit II
MLLGLILRGVAFEFRFKSDQKHRFIWDYSFHLGSLLAAFCQGMIIGDFVHGVEVNGRNFSGGAFDWVSGFSVMTGIATVFGYVLIGSTWLIMKTEDQTQSWARKTGFYSLCFVGIFMLIVSASMPNMNEMVFNRWFSEPNIYYLSIIPIITALLFLLLGKDLRDNKREYRPFLTTIGIFLCGYLGLTISIYPWIIPYQYTIFDAAASSPGLSLMLVAVVPLLPLILGYTGYCYYVFRGKTGHETMY